MHHSAVDRETEALVERKRRSDHVKAAKRTPHFTRTSPAAPIAATVTCEQDRKGFVRGVL